MADSPFVHVQNALEQAFLEDDPQVHAKDRERRNLEVVRQLLGALARGDTAGFLQELSEDAVVEIHAPDDFGFIRYATGKDAIRQLVQHNFDQIEVETFQMVNVVAQGCFVDVLIKDTGKIKATQAPYAVLAWLQFTVIDNKVSHVLEIVAPLSP